MTGWFKENIAPILAVLVTICSFAYLFLETAWGLKQGAAVIALVAAVISFYFGSSSSSSKKDDLLVGKLSPTPAPTPVSAPSSTTTSNGGGGDIDRGGAVG